MRTSVVILSGLLVLAAVVSRAQVNQDGPKPFTHATVEQTEQSLVKALESDSPGLQVSAAATIRELKSLMPDRSFSSRVIPLMRIVKNENADRDARIVAAIALHELNSGKGDYAIKSMARTTSNERFAYICSWLTYYRAKENNPEFATKDTTSAAQLVENK